MTNKEENAIVATTKGYGKYDGMSGEFTFTPVGKGEPVQKNVKCRGRSKFYETAGEKAASFVAHLVARRDSDDPVADMCDDLRKLTAGSAAAPLVLPEGRKLFDSPALKIVADESEREVSVMMKMSYSEAASPAKRIAQLTWAVENAITSNYKLFR